MKMQYIGCTAVIKIDIDHNVKFESNFPRHHEVTRPK